MTKRRRPGRSVTGRTADGTDMPAAEETIRLLPTDRQLFLNECRILALFGEDGPPIRVPEVRFMDPDVGVLTTYWIDGTPLGPKRPTSLDGSDLARAIAVAQTIGRYWPASTALHRLPVTDHLRYHVNRGSLRAGEVVMIASAIAVHPIRWHFAHGELTARHLIKQPSGELAVIEWQRAGIHPAGYDLATLWCTTREVADARPTIEAAVPAKHRSSFLLSALLTALLHLDRKVDTGGGPHDDAARVDADSVVAQLVALAMDGSAGAPS
jgi:hypothetical protein